MWMCVCIFLYAATVGAWTEILHTKMTAASICCITCFRPLVALSSGVKSSQVPVVAFYSYAKSDTYSSRFPVVGGGSSEEAS